MKINSCLIILFTSFLLLSCGQKHHVKEIVMSELKDIRENNVRAKKIVVYTLGDNNPLQNEYLIQLGDEYLLHNKREKNARATEVEYAAGTTRSARENPYRKDITYNAGVERNRSRSQADECSNLLESTPNGVGSEEGIWVWVGYEYSMFGRNGYTAGNLYHMDKQGEVILKKYSLQTADNVISTILNHRNYNDYESYEISVD